MPDLRMEKILSHPRTGYWIREAIATFGFLLIILFLCVFVFFRSAFFPPEPPMSQRALKVQEQLSNLSDDEQYQVVGEWHQEND
jgi:hypothetical protein